MIKTAIKKKGCTYITKSKAGELNVTLFYFLLLDFEAGKNYS